MSSVCEPLRGPARRRSFCRRIVFDQAEHQLRELVSLSGEKLIISLVPKDLTIEGRIQCKCRRPGAEGLQQGRIGATDGVPMNVHAAIRP